METITRVVQYVESHLQRMSSNNLADGDVLNMLGGDGGVQVDAVFYMVSNQLKPVDIEYLRQLASLTNVIPLLAQADLLTPAQVASSKQQIECQLREANIKPFALNAAAEHHLHAISSALGSDHDTMDASLLMSPDYIQPLVPTELAALVDRVFSADGTSRLRHAAARKYLQWRRAETTPPAASSRPPTPLGTSQILLTPPLLGTAGVGSSSALARVADHARREERLAQIRLANWAAELQKSLANERARYEALARGERAVWLTERLGECVQDGTLVPVTAAATCSTGRKGARDERAAAVGWLSSASGRTHRDPLGLLEVVADLRRSGLVVLEVVGSLGVLGGVAVWACRHYGQGSVWQWALAEWERVWYAGR